MVVGSGGDAATHIVACVGPLHLGQADQVGVEHVHLLHLAGEGRLRGLTHLLVHPLRLRTHTDTRDIPPLSITIKRYSQLMSGIRSVRVNVWHQEGAC